MTEVEARAIVEAHINVGRSPPDAFVVLDDATIEKPYGWVFFWQSRAYVETGDFLHMLAGNGPIIVEREGGRVVELGTAFTLEAELGAYERTREG